jgi:drug/metabolite transporter (DMT)-like permease
VRSAWISGLVLVLYAVPFSFAYLSLTAGTGALILFGSVQVTMLVAAWASGERPSTAQWGGLVMAIAGLVGLLLPGITAPPAHGAALMILAGVCWGVYTLRGRGAGNPLQHTAANFIVTAPLVLAVMAASWPALHADRRGMLLAASSGALTSGLGYVLWYEALKGLTATRAAVVQLAVPVIAALGGVVFIGERISLRLVLGGAVVLGGIAMTLVARDRRTTSIEVETG